MSESRRSRGVRASAVVVGASSASAEQRGASAGCSVEVSYEGRWIKVKVDC
ncbi:hypothetical protein [Streptomyces sp. PT12]|uniref:hypothetical protein n=1 Tax=Streptomyces sp. PT12 TaxID=1510197 RepID=UPI0015EEE3D8|nr:hypothetical protein [Streptomyces sp. PT12]